MEKEHKKIALIEDASKWLQKHTDNSKHNTKNNVRQFFKNTNTLTSRL